MEEAHTPRKARFGRPDTPAPKEHPTPVRSKLQEDVDQVKEDHIKDERGIPLPESDYSSVTTYQKLKAIELS